MTPDEKNMEWLVSAIQASPETMVVTRDNLNCVLRKILFTCDAWMFGRHFAEEYKNLQLVIDDLLGESTVSHSDRKNNENLMNTFEVIEEEETLI